MAYFPNGSTGLLNQEEHCFHCVNWKQRAGEDAEGCPVWDLHLLWNYDAVGKKADKTKHIALESLWPDDGRCKLFVESGGSTYRGDGVEYLELTKQEA